MFLDNLVESLHQLCKENHLTYEEVSDRCGISVRFFGDVMRKKRCPSLRVLEKLGNGFQVTPDELLKIDDSTWESLRTAASCSTNPLDD